MHRVLAAHPGDDPVELVLRRSARARRVSLRVSAADGRVTLTLPPGVREADAIAFAQARADWVRAALEKVPQPLRVADGVIMPVEGEGLRVVFVTSRTGPARRCPEAVLEVPGPQGRAGAKVAAFLRLVAHERLHGAVARHAQALGKAPTRLVMRDTRSRWGSCTSTGTLNFSWRLAMAPPDVLDYVAAHEVAHLAEMNHSPRYWAVVRRLMPDFAAPRGWLRSHGARLHAWRFRD